eukprot:g8890.t1 g8890   contig34:376484-377137(+)
MEPVIPEAKEEDEVPMMSSPKNFADEPLALASVIFSSPPSSAPVHCNNGTSWKMMTAVDLRNFTDFEYEEAPPASFARRRVTVSLPTDNDVYGSYHQKRFLGFGMVFDLPPLPFRDFRDVPAGTQTSTEEEFNIFVASTDNSSETSTKQQSLFVKRDTTKTSSRAKILVQESSQQLHENDFFDHDDVFEPLPFSRLVSDDDEFCEFIRMNTHDPFDD